MKMFDSEQHLVDLLKKHDALVFSCARQELDFRAFTEAYTDFYDVYALDGHESDAEEQALLRKYANSVTFHQRVRDEVLYVVCSDSDAELPSYRESGRISPSEAHARLAELANEYSAQSSSDGAV